MTVSAQSPEVHLAKDQKIFGIQITGDWVIENKLPNTDSIIEQLSNCQLSEIEVNTQSLGNWDSGLIAFLVKVRKFAETEKINVDYSALPDGAQRLLNLAFTVEEREGARKKSNNEDIFTRAGKYYLSTLSRTKSLITFIGEIALSVARFVKGKANYQRSDLWVTLQETGAEALPIVSLIAFLVGVILAFVGVVQLVKFGAGIYVADLVAIGVVREMGAIMAGIIMAGRTGAAFAASIGTMKVNEEVDALTTMGINPIDYLVLPKVLALVIMLPLLSIYANVLGIMGGASVSLAILDVSVYQYFVQTVYAVSLTDFLGGLAKAIVYGVLVAVAGCRCGMECGNSASAVGLATTAAVVSGIVLIVVANAIMNVIYTILGI